MPKQLLFCFSALLISVAILGGEALTLRSTGSFDLASKLPREYAGLTVTHAFRTTPTSLYFLISPPQTLQPPQMILKTDLSGAGKSFLPLVKPVSPGWFDLDEAGNLYFWKQMASGCEVYKYNSQGLLVDTIVSKQPLIRIGLIENTLLGVTPAGEIFDIRTAKKLTEPANLGPPGFSGNLLVLSPKRAVAVNANTTTMSVLDIPSGKMSSRQITHEIISESWKTYKTDPDSAAIFSDFTTDRQGTMIFNLSGHPYSGGAVLLMADSNGTVFRDLRCPLPKFDQLRQSGNPAGHMFSGLIGLQNGKIFVVDRNGYVTSCELSQP